MVNPSPQTEFAHAALALVGPTASGKTALALSLATQVPLEIISMDSALVYQGMDIGTAKPSPDELQSVPHHLINIRQPTQSYSAAEFARDATRLIHDIRQRGKLPLLVGGTMLYLKALKEGLDDLPLASADIRADLETQAASLGWPGMHAELAKVDPVTAARLPPNDSQRISRALEVWRVSGQPLSSFFGATRVAGPDIAVVSLEPTERHWLHQRIEERFEAMLQLGLVEEVRGLRQRGGLHADLPSMRCVGYRQCWEMLDALGDASPGPNDLHRLRETGMAASRQLAKRQLTWLRSMPTRHVLACDQSNLNTQWQTLLKHLSVV
jgi:tRNA dimethylallyltransferase